MPQRRRTYSPELSSRRSRQVREQTLGTHVARSAQGRQRDVTYSYAQGVARKARGRRVAAIAMIVAIAAALAFGAGVVAFRGILGTELSLRDSDAQEALVAVKPDEPRFVLACVELGAAAAPLDNGGPDVFLLARLDPGNRSLALVNIPGNLQITVDNRSEGLSEIAREGDAAAISALSTFAKVDISHFVKMGESDVVGLVDALGGIDVDVDQEIDDPQAGSVYLEEGLQRLDGEAALVYLRAGNVALGAQDRMSHQLGFAARVLEKLFSREGSFAARLESASPYFQTDLTLGDIESIYSWLGGLSADEVTCALMPGYTTEATDVSGEGSGRFIGSTSDWAEMLSAIEEGRGIEDLGADVVSGASPSSFTLEIQNGTTIDGAAGVTASDLASKGFSIAEVGNAEQAVYSETLVIYKGDEGPSRAKTVIDALGIGRAVSAGMYYTFDSDVLLIIGSDYKPTA